ncbi:MAG: hypothetical protein LBJ75_02720 [Puniceicoccales bacterium]|jgi:hypothetical protein|nr:hypothetical protein [Puniceicoccales bacterium]
MHGSSTSVLNPNLGALQGTEGAPGTPNLGGTHAVKPGETLLSPEMAAAAEPRSSMPNTDLVARSTIVLVEKSQSMGVGGFFRALWNFISNSSTKSMDQARLNVVVKDYLQSNPGEVDGISQEIAANASSQDPKIVQAFVSALKGVNPKESVIEFSQSALALRSLAQKLPADQITPDLMTFCNNFPEQAQALAERQDLSWGLSQATCDKNGMLPMCKHNEYKPEILNLINAELFEGEGQDARIESFMADPAVASNLFFKDGVKRNDMPHISLPNGVEISSNFGNVNSEYCKNTGGTFDQAEYLKYILGQFKEAYGDTGEAAKAFKVFVQNFTGTGNTFAIRNQIMGQKMAETNNLNKALFYDGLVSHSVESHRSQSTIRMDEGFNMEVNITACMSDKGSIQQLNKKTNSSFNEDTIFGITISTHIPAVISDSMDQRGQEGKQTTNFGIIESFGNGGSN